MALQCQHTYTLCLLKCNHLPLNEITHFNQTSNNHECEQRDMSVDISEIFIFM